MPRPISCCNPLNKNKHSRVYKNLKQINDNWCSVYQKFIGKYVCDTCRRAILKCNSPLLLQDQNDCVPQTDEKNMCFLFSSDDEVDCEKKDATYQPESENKNLKRNFVEDTEVNVKVKQEKLSFGMKNITTENDIQHQAFINEIKVALSKAVSREDKYKILTTLPSDWSIRKIQKTFNISYRIASTAKKMKQLSGYGASCEQKSGRPLSSNVLKEVENFYTDDQQSRLMPGRKDYVSIKKKQCSGASAKKIIII